MKRIVLGLVLAIATATIAAPASANIITFKYFGKITDGTDTSGLFGAANTDLTGDPIEAVFVFDTSLGLRGPIMGATDSLVGGTSAPGMPPSPLLSATITINGQSALIGGGLLASALTDAGHFNASAAADLNLADSVQAFVFTADAPASLDAPFMPHGVGGGSFNIDRMDPLSGLSQIATGDFSIPEPSTWAMMLVGLGGIGAAIRSGRRNRLIAAA